MAAGTVAKAEELARRLLRERAKAQAESERVDEEMERLRREQREAKQRLREQWQDEAMQVIRTALEPLARRLHERVGEAGGEQETDVLMRAVRVVGKAAGRKARSDAALDALGLVAALTGRRVSVPTVRPGRRLWRGTAAGTRPKDRAGTRAGGAGMGVARRRAGGPTDAP